MVKRKNFLPTLLIALLFWVGLISLIFFTAPNSYLILATFYLLLFPALFLTLSLLFANSRRGFLLATGIVVFLVLRLLKMANFLNLILLGAILVSLELYFKKR